MNGNRRYLRFSLPERIEHWVLTLSFTALAVTGLPQKFASGRLSQWTIGALGGIESVRVIHRTAAILLMLEAVYHVVVIGHRVLVRRDRMTILPGLQDARVALHALMHNLGLREGRPQQGRYTFEEKVEYWALVWGTLIMTITGFMLWNPILTARIVPGEFIPAAKAAHGAEAVLAVLAILVWHTYHVHVKHWNKSMFTGYLSGEEMLEEHPLELAEIKAGVTKRAVDPQVLSRQRRFFAVTFGVLAVWMLMGIYYFVTFEETAITTVPPAEDVVVYAPLTPTPLPTPLPTPTPAPTPTPLPTPEPEVRLAWGDGPADIFDQQCSACHSSATKLGGLDLSSYQGALAGGDSGPVIQPGDPDASQLVALIESGDHPGRLSGNELARIRQWIADGALEEPAPLPEEPAPVPEARVTWQDVADLFQQKCGACHSDANALGGLNLSNYQGALAGGVQAGDPDASGLVTLQVQGGHPGQFSEDELERVRQWIADGALEK